MKPLSATRGRARKPLALCLVLILLSVLLSACGGDPQTQQQVNKNKQALDKALTDAQNVGVPANLLQPIILQEQQLTSTHAPLGLFGDQPVNDYYSNLALRYSQLSAQVTGLESQSNQQLHYQAYQDLQTLSNVLNERQNFVEAQTFADQLNSYQQALDAAKLPKDYLQISANAQQTSKALHLMGPAYDSLTSFQQVIQQLHASNIDVAAFNQEAQGDLELFRKATKPEDFSNLIDLIHTQMNETTTVSTAAIPYVGQAKLNQFSIDIQLVKQYNGGDISKYETRLQTDQQDLNNAKSLSDFLHVSGQIDADIASIQVPLTKAQAYYLLASFHHEVTTWGQAHQYHDSYNNQNYPLSYPYDQQGIGSDADVMVQQARTSDDYQTAVDVLNNNILHLHMMEQDYSDKTPYNQAHQEDLTLMDHYGITNASEVLVVSLVEQTVRYYKNGKVVRAFFVTSGQYAKPSLPGFTRILWRESPTVFKSNEPKGSAFWYADTKINFAMEYHAGGFFFHDSWWRRDYGVGTNFPHNDLTGGAAFSGNGSHGCFNMRPSDIAWLYPNTSYAAKVIVY